MSQSPPLVPSRRHDLDALRAVAMLLGIALHAALSFVPGIWVVEDSRSHPAFGLLVTAVHGFRMPLFFLLSGYFTAMLWRKRGLKELLRQRWKRIGRPLLIGLISIVPITWIVLVAASIAEHRRGTATGPRHGDHWTASRHGNTAALERHLEAGADVDALHPVLGTTALTMAATHDEHDIMHQLIDAGAKVNQRNRDGGTALHVAALLGRSAAVKILLERGAEVGVRNHDGQTAQETMLTTWSKTRMAASLLQVWPNRKDVTQGRSEAEQMFIERGSTPLLNEHTAKGSADAWDLLTLVPFFHHLWFLWFLCWLVAGFALFAWWADRSGWHGAPAWLVVSPIRYVWVIVLTLVPQWFMSGVGPGFGPDTSMGLLPMPHVLGYYAVFFAFGVLYHDCEGEKDHVGRRWRWTLPIMLVMVFPMGLEMATGSLGLRDRLMPEEWFRPVSNVLQVLYAWGMSFACMGCFRSVFHGESPRWRYVSDASYWLYLMHLPMVIVLQAWMKYWPLPAVIKLVLICCLTVGVLLLSYHWIVRFTWIGRMLNGPRDRPSGMAGLELVKS